MTAIDDKRIALPFLGNPVDEGGGSGEMDLGDGRGRARDYQNGSIYWTPQTAAHEVHGAIRDLWGKMGFERSQLHYPVTDETGMPGGRVSRFEGGRIEWTQAGGSKSVLSSGFGDDNVGVPVNG
jgi:uncharacterized protein with LGFP repeats